MATRGCSTIHRINILGNSVHGIDILNWHKVYNALVIPVITYRVPVWYTRQHQKWHVNHLQIAQNEGICKILGVFKTTPVEPLHNLMGIPPISYLLPKLIHAYTLRLQAMPPNALVYIVLKTDWCHIWPDYFTPPTTLSCISTNIRMPTYHPLGPCTAGT
jgi:hypothetical protein